MKKILFILLAVIGFGFCANAQDIIILKSGDEIEALVQEVGPDYVLYKKFDNQTGPNYHLNTEKVFMIRYANGTKDVFNAVAKPEEKKEQQQEDVNKQQELPNTPYYSEYQITKVKWNKYSLEGNGKIVFLNNIELANHFKNYCPEAHQMFMKGLDTYKKGNIICAIGSGLFCAGAIGTLYGLTRYRNSNNPLSTAFYCVTAVGFVPGIIGLAIASSAKQEIKIAISEYNSSCVLKNKTTATLNFGVTQSGGIGLTLNY